MELESRLMLHALSEIPALHSLPGAPATLYLDFDGDTTATWGSYHPGTTPAFDEDGDPTTFSDAELSAITEIWARVAEKYSPFRVDVTTVNPGTLVDGKSERIVIGGDGRGWGCRRGLSYVGSFTNGAPNTAWVFSKRLYGSSVWTAEATAHEAGHGFGLTHQSTWNGTTLTATYNPGDANTAPIMGVSYYAARGLWWKGTTSASPTSIQDDLAILAGAADGFGYRADDHGNSVASANALAVLGSTFNGSGVIERSSDADYFSFSTAGGVVDFTASPAAYGPMLDLKLELRRADGTVIASADSAALGESISATVPAGTYYVDVASHGGYGAWGSMR